MTPRTWTSSTTVLRLALVACAWPVAAQEGEPVLERSVAQVLSTDSTFFAEGLGADPRDGTLYVTSIRHRNVYRVSRDGTLTPVLPPTVTDVGAVMGVRVDAARGLLWLTTAGLVHMRGHQPADSAMGELLAVRLADGTIVRRWRLGDGTGIPGELALSSRGEVLVSDGSRAVFYRLRSPAGELETIRPTGLRSPQGIAVNAAGTVAWVADYSRGIFRWDLATDSVVRVTNADGRSIPGVDGLSVLPDGRLIGVHNGAARARVLAVTLDAAGTGLVGFETLDHPMRYEGEPTVGAVVGDRFVFVSSSAWRVWTDAGSRREPREALPQVVLRWLPLVLGEGAAGGNADHRVGAAVRTGDELERGSRPVQAFEPRP
jgi:hypothetical protein